jgi:hypothetical protein
MGKHGGKQGPQPGQRPEPKGPEFPPAFFESASPDKKMAEFDALDAQYKEDNRNGT